MFQALLVDHTGETLTCSVQEIDDARLPPGDVTVAVEYSTVNYKDGLVTTGAGGLVKQYPHVPGVDFAGTVIASEDPRFSAGDPVISTGWRVGETRWGGYAQKARVHAEWLVPLPSGLTARQAMAIGTAGFTAMLAVIALDNQGVTPQSGEVLVTGAAGGVGSIACAILANRGYQVVASTGRPDAHEYLRELGVTTVIDRSPFAEPAKRPLEGERWAGCVDSVGGNTLARILAQTKYRGSVAAVGLAGGSKLDHTVIPFLLRGVNLLGIDSVMCPMQKRREAWSRLLTDLPLPRLEAVTTQAVLRDVPRLAREILDGRVRGRVVIDVNG